jgi:hypothetical protein
VETNCEANLDSSAVFQDLAIGFLPEENLMKSSVLPGQSLPYYFSPAKECRGTKQQDDIQIYFGDCGLLPSTLLPSAGAFFDAS